MSSHQPSAAGQLHELYERARSGGVREESALFEALGERFRYLAKQRVWDKDDAMDVAQQALMVVAEKYRDVEIEISFGAWTYTILKNKILNYSKARARASARQDPLATADLWPANDSTMPEVSRQLLFCLEKVGRINRRYARILNYSYHGFGSKEICAKFDISRNALYVALNRARSMLLKCLETGGKE